jgi:Na+/H+ antiporter NhaD/arsenite permease-like protein
MVVLAILFAGLFACAVPVMAMLQGGRAGALAPLLAGVTAADDTTRVVATFWLAGAFSAVMNNAPAYLGFFLLAGGDAHVLMGPLASTLGAISLGAVTIGALTYIGNAPNLLVQTIALERGYKMPGFFGYMLWAGAILLPVLLLLTFMFMA